MLTARGWWFLFAALLVLVLGLIRSLSPLVVLGLALLLWFAAEWLLFSFRIPIGVRRLRVVREVGHEGEAASATTWAGNTVAVRLSVVVKEGGMRLPYLTLTDRVPFGTEYVDGQTTIDGEVSVGRSLEVAYRVRCPNAGTARFEGVHVQVADLQGFFYHAAFVRAPVTLRVLPRFLQHKVRQGSAKRHNLLPPPGIHRLKRPGAGSELLDLRDYVPGDPPKTIAWKVSARRDRLMTKEFESEVPIRCTLFLDTSNSVRILSAPLAPPGADAPGSPRSDVAGSGRPLDQLLEIAAGVLQANTAIRDMTGLCLFDEQGTRTVRPRRSTTHRMEVLRLLAETADLTPLVARTDPRRLLPLAYAFAQQVYPDLLRPEINAMPFWANWIDAFPRHSRHPGSLTRLLHLFKRPLFVFAVLGLPGLSTILSLYVLLDPEMAFADKMWVSALCGVGSTLLFFLLGLLFGGVLLITGRQRREARWRKRLAALLAARHALGPGGLAALLEDDDLFSLHVQKFLADHHIPFALPMYDPEGRYLFAAPEKVPVLAKALTAATSRGQDNELFVLLADLLELDDHLGPLVQAVRVARGRHHQVILVCPWPAGVPLPQDQPEGEDRILATPARPLRDLLEEATRMRFHSAYHRLRKRFLRLGVPVVCAASDEPLPLILERIERLRVAGRR
jgi:uncharacterized protein (DUF58 family)